MQLQVPLPNALSALLDAVADGVLAQDPEGHLVYANAAAAHWLGYASVDALLSTSWPNVLHQFDVVDADGNPFLLSQMPGRRAIQGETDPQVTLRTRLRHTNLERWLVVKSKPVQNDAGEIAFAVTTFQDVTAERQAQRALEESRLRLQAIFDNVQDGILIADDTGHYVDANPAACQLTGYSREEILALSIGAFSLALRQPVVPNVWNQFTNGAPPQHIGEYIMVRKDGTQVETEHRSVANFLPGLHLAVIHDISERKRVERQLARRLAQMEAIYDLSSAVNRADRLDQIYAVALEGLVDHLGADRGSILLFDTDGVMRFKAWRGLSDTYRQQTEGHSPWAADAHDPLPVLVPNLDETDDFESLREIIASEGINALGFIPLLSNGKLLGKFMIYYNQPHPFTNSEVQFVRTLASHVAFAIERQSIERTRQDLLQREHQARLAAEKADALKVQFLAMVSHELRTPLTSIKGFTSTLLAEDVEFNSSDQRDFLQIMDQESDKLSDLIEQLIDISRLQAGTLRVKIAEQPLQNALNVSRRQLELLTCNHYLVIRIGDTLPPIAMDEQRIGQVLVNLVANAAKYAPAHTTITITAREENGTLRVDVCDEGEGIPSEARETVFEAFRQVDRQERQRGAGLGLAICKGVVEAHGGKIWIEDRMKRGTCVVFTLPLVRQPS